MNNVGDIKTFILNGNTATEPLRYVWKWWDGSVDVTNTGTVAKQLNVGGNPADGFQVRYDCEVVNSRGQSSVYSGALVVNNPPSLVLGATSLSKNGADFTFRTNASLIAYDLEGSALGFKWYAGGQQISGNTQTVVGSVNGTYAGTIAAVVTGVQSQVNYDVKTNGSLTCQIYDMDGGTTAIQFYLFGQAATQSYSAPQATGYQSAIDAAYSPTVRIGAGEYAEFAVYTQANANPTSFTWSFYGSNGWAATTFSSGTTTPLEDGAFRNTVLKSTYGETVGEKKAQCRIVDTATTLASEVLIAIRLEENQGPEVGSYSVLPANPSPGDLLEFSVTATDPDYDILTYKWYFPDLSLTMWGRKVYVDSTGISIGNPVHSIVTITDRLGKSVTQSVDSDVLQ